MPQGHVYILASKRNGTLYIGVTNDLPGRIHAHREGRGSAFTKRLRTWKLDLIEKDNPNWDDLYETLL
jgi:putative endonuclease